MSNVCVEPSICLDPTVYSTKGQISLAFTSIGLFFCLEMLFLVNSSFRKHSGLYFWSLTGAILAEFILCWSNILDIWILEYAKPAISLSFSIPAYWVYVPAQFLILYSRLSLLQTSKRVLKFTIWAIVLEFFLVEIPVAVLEILTTLYPDSVIDSKAYTRASQVEGIIYTVLHLALLGLYALQVKRLWGDSNSSQEILRPVLFMSAICVAIDITYTVLTYTVDDILLWGSSVS
jgi:hypothetical protein